MQLWSRLQTLPTPHLQIWIKPKHVFVKDGWADNSEKSLCTRNSEKLDFREDIPGGGGGWQASDSRGHSEVSAQQGEGTQIPTQAAPSWISCGGLGAAARFTRGAGEMSLLRTVGTPIFPSWGGQVRHYLKRGSLASNKRCDNPERYSSLEMASC